MSTSNSKWYRLFFFAGGNLFLVAMFACLLVSAALGAMTPIKIADLSKYYGDEKLYYDTLKFLGALFVCVYLNRAIYQYCINRYIFKLMDHVRVQCFENWLYAYDIKSNREYKKDIYTQGEVVARIMNDTEALRELMTSGTFGIFINIFFVISCLVSFINLNQVSGLFLSGIEIVATFLLIWGSRYMRDIFLKVREARAAMSRLLSNMVGGIKETYYTNHEHYASKKGDVVFSDFLKKMLMANVWDAGYYSTAESLYPILLIFVVVIFPYSKITEAAIIFAVVDLIQRSIGPIKEIAAKIANIQRAYSGIIRINEFIEDIGLRISSKSHQTGGQLELAKAIVNIKKFEYARSEESEQEQTFSLDDIYFEAFPGQLIGIVGLSGCGKSTLLNIMAANIFPLEGSITLESVDGRKAEFTHSEQGDIITYREQVGIVSQDSHIFSDTVAFNISMGAMGADDHDLKSFWEGVVKDVPYLKDWGIALGDKLNQRSLSLGQKQLIAAIRSCYLTKPVVLFDEISSGLDNDLELALRNMVLLIQKKSLTFIVAHRLETILGADQIIVMDNGRIIDRGVHSGLLASSKVYNDFIGELS